MNKGFREDSSRVVALIAFLLSLTAGCADAASFLMLKGLLCSHVTGNFVTLAASIVFGTSAYIAKVLALPAFLSVLALTRLAGGLLHGRLQRWRVPIMLLLQFVLLSIAAWLGVVFGPFANADGGLAVGVGMLLVSAMAVQNEMRRAHISTIPPTTAMTMNSVNAAYEMFDVAGRRTGGPGARGPTTRHFLLTLCVMAGFAAECTISAVVYVFAEKYTLFAAGVPAFITLVISPWLPSRMAAPEEPRRHQERQA